MSTNLECLFVTNEHNQSYYILENYDAPKNVWDWREYATCYGPFKSLEAAAQHLHDNHANPGGSSKMEYKTGDDAVLDRLIVDARNIRPHNRFSRFAY